MQDARIKNPGQNAKRGDRRKGVGHVRIIAGEWRGHRISVVSRPQLRPTPDRLRETLFSWIGDRIKGSRVLDLFAGSGVLGFESLSRGAQHATFVDKDRRTIEKLKEACHKFELNSEQAKVVDSNAIHWLNQNQERWDLVFIDPPFQQERHYGRVLTAIESRLSGDGLIYVESPARGTEVACSLPEWRQKIVGEVRIQLFKRSID